MSDAQTLLMVIVSGKDRPGITARFVNQKACDHGIFLDQTACVGDGGNDALMLAPAGLAIAYNTKKGLDRSADVAMGKSGMTDILHLRGSPRRISVMRWYAKQPEAS